VKGASLLTGLLATFAVSRTSAMKSRNLLLGGVMGLPETWPSYLFHCRHCQGEILLRIETLWQQPGVQAFQSTGIRSLGLACPWCRLAGSYSMEANTPNHDPTGKLVAADRKSDGMCAGVLRCGEESCGIPLPLFSLVSIPIDDVERRALLGKWEWDLRCHNGHPIAKPY